MDNSRFRNLEAPSGKTTMVNRTQALVLGFFVLAWASLVVILLAAPGVYDGAIKLPSGSRPPPYPCGAGLTSRLAIVLDTTDV